MTADEPRDPRPPPPDLERLSEGELEARILHLKSEIEACETELGRKRSHRLAADALFRGS